MTSARLLGIDVGTSSAKAVLIDSDGSQLAAASRDHATYSPAPGWQEQAAEDWWRGSCEATSEVLERTGTAPDQIAGLSLSGQGCACLPVDKAGNPLRRALIWTDARAAAQQAHIREVFGKRLGDVTGNDIYDQPEPRMMWLRDNEPAVYQQTACFMSTASYLLYRFTGKQAANTSDWGFHLALDRESQDWNQEFLDGVGLSHDKFPDLYMPHEIVGGVTEDAARDCGLKPGILVVAGGQDATVAALAVGSLEPGQSVFMRGTTDLLSFCTERAAYHPDLYTTIAALPGLYMRYDMKEVVAAGGSNRWLSSILYGEATGERFEAMNALAEDSPPGAGGILYLPYLLISTNPDPERERTGVFFGLTTATSRGDLCRAVMEGTALALRESIERTALAGIETSELRPTGGPTKSGLWNQITADVTGLPVLLSSASAGAAYGAALLAGLGVGIIPMDDGYETLRSMIDLRERYEPRTEVQATYERAYAAFVELAEATSGIVTGLKRRGI